jgi:hypothetical protein
MLTRGAIQKIVIYSVIAVIVIGLLYFIYRTSRAYFEGPRIIVSEPADYSAFSSSTAVIKGTALHVQDITIDGRSITIDGNGNFSETILLLPGYNIETIAGHDQFGHTSSERLELIYTAPANPVSSSTATTTR